VVFKEREGEKFEVLHPDSRKRGKGGVKFGFFSPISSVKLGFLRLGSSSSSTARRPVALSVLLQILREISKVAWSWGLLKEKSYRLQGRTHHCLMPVGHPHSLSFFIFFLLSKLQQKWPEERMPA
jgi:hypothetical protein